MPAPPSRAQRLLARAMRRQFGPQFGLGGAVWDAYAPTGDDGPADAPAFVAAGTWAGFVRRTEPTRAAQAAPGAVVGAEQWIAHGDAADLTDAAGAAVGLLLPGHIIVSQVEPERAYLVGSPVDVAGYVRWLVEPTAPPEAAAAAAGVWLGMGVGGLIPLTYGASYGG